jgi:hypothetical protein
VKLQLSVNRGITDKTVSSPLAYREGFENVELGLDELTAEISAGHATCAQLKGARRAENFLASNVAWVDVDRGLTIEAALQNPLVREHALLLHTTASHKPERPRFRIIFALPRTITDAAELKAVSRSLALRLSGDPAATDPTRIFFGNRAAQFFRP